MEVGSGRQHSQTLQRGQWMVLAEQSKEVADYIGDSNNLLGISGKLLQAVNGCQMDPAEVQILLPGSFAPN